eukprot:Colp12_sorted_trinity150504_noHs@32035
MADYEAEAKKTYETLCTYFDIKDEEWTLVKKTALATVQSTPSKSFEGHLYRCEALLEASPEDVFAHLNPKGPLRLKWDKSVKSLEILESLSDNLSIAKSTTHPVMFGLISSRDFIDLIYENSNEKFIATTAHGIEHPSYPPCAHFVRGVNYECGLFACRVPGNNKQTRLINFIQSDIKGMLPKSAVESAMPNALITFCDQLRTFITKK